MPEEHPLRPQCHIAPRSPALAAPRASFPSAATAALARANLRLARQERDGATAEACLAVIEAHETAKPVQRHVLDAAMRLHLADAR